MNTVRQLLITVAVLAALVAYWVSAPAAQTDSQNVLRIESTPAGARILCLYWPGITGVARVPLVIGETI